MSLRYKLFGIPGNFDEFIDHSLKRGDKKVKVDLYEYDKPGFRLEYVCGVLLRSGKAKYEHIELKYLRSSHLPSVLVKKAEMMTQIVKNAIDV